MRHRRLIGVRLIGVYLCALAAWMQFVAPVAALSMERSADPFSVICAKAAIGQATTGQDTTGQNGGSHTHHKCDHCLVCHACLGGLSETTPAFTAFDYPAASPLRWRRVQVETRPRIHYRGAQPRGPPTLV